MKEVIEVSPRLSALKQVAWLRGAEEFHLTRAAEVDRTTHLG